MNRRRAPTRAAAAVVVAAVVIVVAGCTSTDSEADASPAPSATSASPTPKASEAAVAVSPVEYWNANPATAPEGFAARDVILDVRGTGPGPVQMPDLSAYASVQLVFSCASSHSYWLTLVGSEPKEAITTGGTDCKGTTGWNTYTALSLPASITTGPAIVRINTGQDVAYDLSVMGTRTDQVQDAQPSQ